MFPWNPEIMIEGGAAASSTSAPGETSRPSRGARSRQTSTVAPRSAMIAGRRSQKGKATPVALARADMSRSRWIMNGGWLKILTSLAGSALW